MIRIGGGRKPNRIKSNWIGSSGKRVRVRQIRPCQAGPSLGPDRADGTPEMGTMATANWRQARVRYGSGTTAVMVVRLLVDEMAEGGGNSTGKIDRQRQWHWPRVVVNGYGDGEGDGGVDGSNGDRKRLELAREDEKWRWRTTTARTIPAIKVGSENTGWLLGGRWTVMGSRRQWSEFCSAGISSESKWQEFGEAPATIPAALISSVPSMTRIGFPAARWVGEAPVIGGKKRGPRRWCRWWRWSVTVEINFRKWGLSIEGDTTVGGARWCPELAAEISLTVVTKNTWKIQKNWEMEDYNEKGILVVLLKFDMCTL